MNYAITILAFVIVAYALYPWYTTKRSLTRDRREQRAHDDTLPLSASTHGWRGKNIA